MWKVAVMYIMVQCNIKLAVMYIMVQCNIKLKAKKQKKYDMAQ